MDFRTIENGHIRTILRVNTRKESKMRKKIKKIKYKCGGFIDISLLEQGGEFLCSKGHAHSAKVIRKHINEKKQIRHKQNT